MRANYPTESDVQRFLLGSGLTTDQMTYVDLAGLASAAQSEWERASRFIPFLAGSTDTTVRYNPRDVIYPPGRPAFLDLRAKGGPRGVTSITSFTVGVTTTSAGSLLTANRDYRAQPGNNAAKNRPYTYIEFIRPPFVMLGAMGGIEDSLVMVARSGYCTQLDEVVFQAVLQRAAMHALEQMSNAVSGGLKSVSIGDHRFDWGGGAYATFMERAEASWAAALGTIVRV